MMKSITTRIGAVAAVAAASIMVASTPAQALDGYGYGHEFHEHRGHDDDDYRRGGYYRVSGYDDGYRGYDDGYRGYRNNGYRGHRCRDKGVGGAVIGAIAGGLLGNAVAGRGNRTTGTVVGGAVGAVAGHVIDKKDGRPC